jgi:glycosyltransferase involved in cell wall biosynthesis
MARLFVARRAAGVILYGRLQRDAFVKAGFDPERLFVANNTIDTQRINDLAKPWDSTARHRILVIGRLLREKKVDLVLRAFALSASDLPVECVLTIIGEGPERSRLEQLAEALGISDRVEFAGAIYEEVSLAVLFNQALVAISGGYIGLGIIHSFAYGVPMLVARDESHSPEIEALEEGKNGALFPSDNPQALSAMLKEVLNDRVDLGRMSESALQTVADVYSLENMVGAFERAVEKAIR